MQSENGSDQRRVAGTIKWFDPQKGFGFILSEAGGPDILLHINVLRNFGQNSISDGTAIEVLVQQTRRGLQAVEVVAVHLPASPGETRMEELADISSDEIAALPLQPARVKWFDKVRGFGFANIFGAEPDVFVHVDVLRRSGFAEVAPGEAIALRAIEGGRGQMAVQVAPWEAALPDRG